MAGKRGRPRKVGNGEIPRNPADGSEGEQTELPPISEERIAVLRERLHAAEAAAYAKDPHYREHLWRVYSRSLFDFMLKDYFRSLAQTKAATDDADQNLSENS